VTGVAADLVALHATDPATVYLAAAARTRAPEIAAVEHALYDERSLVRMLAMRRTMFVLPAELAPVVQVACTATVAARERRRLVGLLDEAGVADDPVDWLKEVEESTVRSLLGRGEATAAELSADEPRLREQVVVAPGKSYEARQNIASRVLLLLAADGRIVRGRPAGSWTSTRYRWSAMETWLPEHPAEPPADQARAELARRWLAAYGPGTVADLKWWTGWSAGEVRRALAEVGPVEVDLDGTTGLVLPGDVEPVTAPEPWVALLPALDPTAMGWTERDWFLGGHRAALFDRTGNIGPTVWSDGRIIGGWAQRGDGEIVFRLLEDGGRDVRTAVEEAAGRLGAWLGEDRVVPRFRTPLERELCG
jgi:hypothetical protein